MAVYQWSTSAASNASADANIDWSEGQLPSTVNDSARAMMAALAAMIRDQGGYATLGGSGNTFTLTLSQTMTSKVPALLGFFATRSNTGAVTMNVDGSGAYPLRQVSGTELVSGQIVSGSFYIISWNSSTTEWIAINAPPIGNYLLSATAASTYLPFTGGTLTGNLSIINSTTEMQLTLGSSSGYYYGNATTAGFKNSGGTNRVSWDISTGDFTAAGGITGTNVTASTTVVSDTISERTAAAGVTIDGVLCKDSQVAPANRVITAGSTVTATGGSVTLASGLPNWVKRITVTFKGVSLNSGQNILIQLGTSGGVVTVGYQATSNRMGAAGTNNSTSTGGFIINNSDAGFFFNGAMQICAIDTPARGWVSSHSGRNDGSFVVCGGGDVTLAADLTSVTAVTTGGASFDNGSINIFYE